MARKATGKPNGGARPGGGRKPKPTDPIQWSGMWARIDTELAPKALDALAQLVEQGDKDAVFFALRMAGFQRTYQDALAATSQIAPGGGGLSVTFTHPPAGTSLSLSYPASAAPSKPSSGKGDGT